MADAPAVLKMLKLKQNVEKVKKTMCEKMEISTEGKPRKNQKNSGAEKYNN